MSPGLDRGEQKKEAEVVIPGVGVTLLSVGPPSVAQAESVLSRNALQRWLAWS